MITLRPEASIRITIRTHGARRVPSANLANMHQGHRVEELLSLLHEGPHLVQRCALCLLLKDCIRLAAEPSVGVEMGPGVLAASAGDANHQRSKGEEAK